jgi:hypothetical protein
LDLNEEFANFLLSDEFLDDIASRLPWSTGPNTVTDALWASLLKVRRADLFDRQGRDNFGRFSGGAAHLLARLANVFHIDCTVSGYFSKATNNSMLVYKRYYECLGLASRIPSSVTLVGISVAMGPQLAPGLLLAAHLGKIRPDLKIVLGGPVISLMAREDRDVILKCCSGVHALVRFDGELPLAMLAEQALRGDWKPDQVPGTSSISDGVFGDVPPSPGPHLDDLPFGDYDRRLISKLSNPGIGLVQARGCYWGQCSYCDFVELYEGSPAYRTRRTNRLVDEMEHHSKTLGVSQFSIITEALPPAFALRMSHEILRRKITAGWHSFVMVDKRFTRETMEAMVCSGCDYVIVGMETMNDRVLSLVKKAARREDNLAFLQNAHEVGLRVKVNIIPDLPSTTYAEAMHDLNVLKSVKRSLSSIAIFPFEATRSSEIGRAPESFLLQLKTPDHATGQAQFASNHLYAVDPAMTAEERRSVHQAYRRFAREVTMVNTQYCDVDERTLETNGIVSLADDLLIEELNGVLYCYRLATRQLFRMSSGCSKLLDALRQFESFRPNDIVEEFRSASGAKEFLYKLARHGLLRRQTSNGKSPP